jgi:mannose-6-phosphate isomerase-like protein (cupin superfamily)
VSRFETRTLQAARREPAPDGSWARPLLRVTGGSMAHFALAPGAVSRAVRHRSVEEIWYVVSGRGEMWRRQGPSEAVVTLEPGVCVTIPRDTEFQFRATESGTLEVIATTMPPWPGDAEAVRTHGPWTTSEP